MSKRRTAQDLEFERLSAEFMKSQAFRDMVDASGIVKQTYGRGLADGQAKALLTQLMQRFGELPESVVNTVRAADTSRINHWLVRVLESPDLESVFQNGGWQERRK